MGLTNPEYNRSAIGRQGKKGSPLVSVVIVNYNGKHNLEDCLPSLMDQTYRNTEIIVVDCGSTDGSVEYISRNFPTVKVIETNKNVGYTKANNIGIKQAKGDLFFIMNDDTISNPDLIEKLVHTITIDRDVGIVGPKVVSIRMRDISLTQGHPVISIPTRDRAWTNLGLWFRESVSVPVYTVSLNMVAMLIKKSVIEKIGLFDESLVMYFSEDDFCLRAVRANFQLVYDPTAVIRHKGGGTIGRMRMRKMKLFLQGAIRYRLKYPALEILPSFIFSLVVWSMFFFARLFGLIVHRTRVGKHWQG